MEIWRGSDRNNFAKFFWDTEYNWTKILKISNLPSCYVHSLSCHPTIYSGSRNLYTIVYRCHSGVRSALFSVLKHYYFSCVEYVHVLIYGDSTANQKSLDDGSYSRSTRNRQLWFLIKTITLKETSRVRLTNRRILCHRVSIGNSTRVTALPEHIQAEGRPTVREYCGSSSGCPWLWVREACPLLPRLCPTTSYKVHPTQIDWLSPSIRCPSGSRGIRAQPL